MRLPRKELEPGEWQEEVNQYGGVRRYRMIGNCKEYEMDVTVDGITIPQSQLEDYHRRKKRQNRRGERPKRKSQHRHRVKIAPLERVCRPIASASNAPYLTVTAARLPD